MTALIARRAPLRQGVNRLLDFAASARRPAALMTAEQAARA
jgi:hypothetical protein